jgi:hypothetical protein
MSEQRQVGKPRDALVPAKTSADFSANMARADLLQRAAARLCPIIRKPHIPGTPRVQRFRTLDEMNADQENAKAEFMAWLSMQRKAHGG